MAKSSFSRREFLKISALGSAALTFSNCSTADRYFMGDVRNLEKEVVILGAGAAGLAAAYELKKRKVPFRIYEASSRLGGRVQSVSLFSEDGPIGELGAEFFENTHEEVFRFAKELNLQVQELKTPRSLEAHLFYFGGRSYKVKDIVPRLRSFQQPLKRIQRDLFRGQSVVLNYRNALQYEKASYYDSLSLKALLETWQSELDPVISALIEVQAVSRFGVDSHEQSSLHFLSTLDSEGSSLLTGRPTYRMANGLSSLTQTMAARVAGVIPEHTLRTNRPLIEIEEKDGRFTLTFQGPRNKEVVFTRNIICTLPLTRLRQVKGLERLRIGELKKEALQNQSYATHSKGLLIFDSPFWSKNQGTTPANLGNFTGDFTTQKIWDTGRTQEGRNGLLAYQRAGESGLNAGSNAPQVALKDLGLFYKEMPPVDSDRQPLINWRNKIWSQGSMAYFKPGQYMRLKGVAGESEYNGHLQFAGEHTSLRFAGTLQGALESGVRAANAVKI